MKVGFLQFNPEFGRKEKNLDTIANILHNKEADLMVLPELCTTGFNFIDKEEARSFAEPFENGPTRVFLKDLARELNMALVAGFLEKEGSKVFNSLMFLPPDGEDILYRKLHLFDRGKLTFDPGDIPFRVHAYRGIKLGFAICFDWIYPEAFRTLALQGAQIICHCTNLVLPFYPMAALVRAVENGVFIVYSNRTGSENRGGIELGYIGTSRIVSPRGEILAEADKIQEITCIVEIDPTKASDKNITGLNHLFDDRRPEFYKL
ncbi:hypothetical protein JW877_02335 [bacterium]|nr:hypothetical protein [bacterium]